jgi:hypothetical protein
VISSDVSPGEMKSFDDMSEQDVARLLSGSVPEGQAELDGVASFFAQAALTYPEPSTDAFESADVAAMLDTARAQASARVANGTAADRDAELAGAPWGTIVRGFFARTSARVAAVAVAVAIIFGGTAYAGILPAPLQTAVAGAARAVGISLPDPSTHPGSGLAHPSEGRAAPAPIGDAGVVRGGPNASETVGAPAASRTATGSANSRKGTVGKPPTPRSTQGAPARSSKAKGAPRKASHGAARRAPHPTVRTRSGVGKDDAKEGARR